MCAAQNLSLEGAIGIDKCMRTKNEERRPIPLHTFHPSLFRQPSLAEGRLKPSSYRKRSPVRIKSVGFAAGAIAMSQLGAKPTTLAAAVEDASDDEGSGEGDATFEVERDVSQLLEGEQEESGPGQSLDDGQFDGAGDAGEENCPFFDRRDEEVSPELRVCNSFVAVDYFWLADGPFPEREALWFPAGGSRATEGSGGQTTQDCCRAWLDPQVPAVDSSTLNISRN